jgi:hypothetical protein
MKTFINIRTKNTFFFTITTIINALRDQQIAQSEQEALAKC